MPAPGSYVLHRAVIPITAQHSLVRRNTKGLDENYGKKMLSHHRGGNNVGYSILILICSTALSHSDCRPNTPVDVFAGLRSTTRSCAR
jgi:hypothetical protein